ncbi:serine hydrolase domain-containing protein [Microtetraspora fusca]|uniref:Serine hydrolase domain-containing protein n=1 Tax=Microtetraspora fusca TaxID=1997 RepID=A0ABW6V010_MICFU
MSALDSLADRLADRLPGLLAAGGVPGAGLAVLVGDEIVEHAAGVLNTTTGVAATTDSIFQIGSITKIWTATLAMQLVDEGRLDLDAPVREYLPGFRLRDESAARTVTARHLAAHTAGFDGDVVPPVEWGDQALAAFVDGLGGVGQIFPPGLMFSYNNLGYVVLGRLVEVLRGRPYDQCLREHLLAPLGITHAAPTPWEAVMRRTAVGHIGGEPAPHYAPGRLEAPAGSVLAMRARDLLTFVRMHLRDGLADDGTRVLSRAGTRLMRSVQVEQPDLGCPGDARGLGWALYGRPGGTLIGHNGGTVGQNAYLRVVPERGIAVALLTNGGDPAHVYEEVVGGVLAELAGIIPPPRPAPAADPRVVDAWRYVGVYANDVAETTVEQDASGRLWMTIKPIGAGSVLLGAPEPVELLAYRGDTLLTAGEHTAVAFLGDDGQGRALYGHAGRAVRRVA